jgi:dTDP-4-amino-4,6-dideoxygalactose transaminase
MNELQAAFDPLLLKTVNDEIKKRKAIAEVYRQKLGDIRGIRVLRDIPGVA